MIAVLLIIVGGSAVSSEGRIGGIYADMRLCNAARVEMLVARQKYVPHSRDDFVCQSWMVQR